MPTPFPDPTLQAREPHVTYSPLTEAPSEWVLDGLRSYADELRAHRNDEHADQLMALHAHLAADHRQAFRPDLQPPPARPATAAASCENCGVAIAYRDGTWSSVSTGENYCSTNVRPAPLHFPESDPNRPCLSLSAQGTRCLLTMTPGRHGTGSDHVHEGRTHDGHLVGWAAGNGQPENQLLVEVRGRLVDAPPTPDQADLLSETDIYDTDLRPWLEAGWEPDHPIESRADGGTYFARPTVARAFDQLAAALAGAPDVDDGVVRAMRLLEDFVADMEPLLPKPLHSETSAELRLALGSMAIDASLEDDGPDPIERLIIDLWLALSMQSRANLDERLDPEQREALADLVAEAGNLEEREPAPPYVPGGYVPTPTVADPSRAEPALWPAKGGRSPLTWLRDRLGR